MTITCTLVLELIKSLVPVLAAIAAAIVAIAGSQTVMAGEKAVIDLTSEIKTQKNNVYLHPTVLIGLTSVALFFVGSITAWLFNAAAEWVGSCRVSVPRLFDPLY